VRTDGKIVVSLLDISVFNLHLVRVMAVDEHGEHSLGVFSCE
jgi:hypothetical protein